MTSVHGPSPSAPVFTNLKIHATRPPPVREQARKYQTRPGTPSFAAVPGWHAEPRHPVEHIASDFCLGPLIGQSPGVETPADDGLIAKHRRFDQTPAAVARGGMMTAASGCRSATAS